MTGYSLGGALAVLAALDIQEIFGHVESFYSFGQPRVGNELFSDFFVKKIKEHYRIVHYADIVPHFPPHIPIYYNHFANEVWYDETMTSFKLCGA